MNDQGWRYLRTVESRTYRIRAVLVIALGIVAAALLVLFLGWFIFGLNTGPHV